MTCTSFDGTGQPWTIDFEVDTREYPWRALWSYGNFGSYFETDPNGDIVHKRGAAAVPPPTPGVSGQPMYYAEVTQPAPDLVQVTIGSQYFDHSLIYTMRAGYMVRALRTASSTSTGTQCFPNP
jgi:hypothetical protein